MWSYCNGLIDNDKYVNGASRLVLTRARQHQETRGKLFKQLKGDSQSFQTLLKLYSFYFFVLISGLLESKHNSLCKGWNNSKYLTFSALQLMCLSN